MATTRRRGAEIQFHALVRLPAHRSSPGAARAIVYALAHSWGFAPRADDARLLVSELVTNAVQHAAGTDAVELHVMRREECMRIALVDGSVTRPTIRGLDPNVPAGRGMVLVDAIADGWGTDDHAGGKSVWVDLKLPD
jgi:anti-sigma regulatory factor (Ser/Thr protein kinase)